MSSIINKLKKNIDKENYDSKDKLDFLSFPDDLYDKKKDDDKYSYPILRSKAISIAKKNGTLKTDFCRNSNNKGISYLGFTTYDIKPIEKDNKTYWLFQVFDGDISWIEFNDNNTTYCDGRFSDDDIKYLRCLIDVNTGDYIYYPNVKKYQKRIVKNKEEPFEYSKYYSKYEVVRRIFEEDNDEKDN